MCGCRAEPRHIRHSTRRALSQQCLPAEGRLHDACSVHFRLSLTSLKSHFLCSQCVSGKVVPWSNATGLPRAFNFAHTLEESESEFWNGHQCWAEPFQHLWSDVLCLLRLSLHECIGRSSWDCHPPDNLLKGSKRQSKRVHVSGSA